MSRQTSKAPVPGAPGARPRGAAQSAGGGPGQFNLDFMCMLVLSGLWVAWRHQFSGAGLALGVLAFFGGAFFLTAYLLVMSVASGGDVKILLLGTNRDG